MKDKKCKNCKWFTYRILPPDDLGICTIAEDFTPARWQKENRVGCNKWERKTDEDKQRSIRKIS